MSTLGDRTPRCRRACALALLLACVAACGGRGGGGVVARSGDHVVKADDLLLAVRGQPEPAALLADRERVKALVTDILLEEALAAEARASIPGAKIRARVAARTRAIGLLLDAGPPTPEQVEAHYREHPELYRIPDEVRVARMTLPNCNKAVDVREEVAAGKITFAAAAKRDSTDAESAARAADPPWQPEPTLPPPVRRALGELAEKGAISQPMALDVPPAPRPQRAPGPSPKANPFAPTPPPAPRGPAPALPREEPPCLLVQLVDRKAGRAQTFAEVRVEVEHAAAVAARGQARQELLKKIGFSATSSLGDGGMAVLSSDLGAGNESAVIVAVGEDRLTRGEAFALFGRRAAHPAGMTALATRLAEDLALWQEARRRGIDRRVEVRVAERASLALEARARLGGGAATQPASSAASGEQASAALAAIRAKINPVVDWAAVKQLEVEVKKP